MGVIHPTESTLTIQPLTSDNGYTTIKMFEADLINETKIILHLIKPREIQNIIIDLENNVDSLKKEYRNIINNEIQIVKSKLKSITPSQTRTKRGLLNVIGSAQKWLFGLMDDEDRQHILEHLEVTKANNHNIIAATNQQITINEHFNRSITMLKDSIKEDRLKIENSINKIQSSYNEIFNNLQFHSLIMKLKILEEKIDQIQDNIASAKYNLFHPSILTAEEIEINNIDFYKLKLIRMGVLIFAEDTIVFAIKIPDSYIHTTIKLIIPLPNENNLEIAQDRELVTEINGIHYTFEQEKLLKDLKISKNCIFYKNCYWVQNNKTLIETLTDDTILIINAKNTSIYHNCENNNNVKLNKNHVITYNNCTLNINNNIYSNKKTEFYDKIIDLPLTKHDFPRKLTFDEIVLEHIENIKEIKEIKFENEIMLYGGPTILTIIIITVIITIMCIKRKETIIINKRIRENPPSKVGGVTYVIPPVDEDIPTIVNKYLNNK